ncbi:MAG: TonB family protein [bacterium]
MVTIPMLNVILGKSGLGKKAAVIENVSFKKILKRKEKPLKRKTEKKQIADKKMRFAFGTHGFNFDLGAMSSEGAAVALSAGQKDGIYEMGQVDEPPNLISVPPVLYPPRAEDDQVEGEAVLELIVNEAGRVFSARVIRETPPGYGFGQAAVKAYLNGVFSVPKSGGVPVKYRAVVPVEFVLN